MKKKVKPYRCTWLINPKSRVVPNKKKEIKLSKQEIDKIRRESDF